MRKERCVCMHVGTCACPHMHVCMYVRTCMCSVCLFLIIIAQKQVQLTLYVIKINGQIGRNSLYNTAIQMKTFTVIHWHLSKHRKDMYMSYTWRKHWGGGGRDRHRQIERQTERLRRGRQIKTDRQRGRMGWGGGGSQLTYSTDTVYTGMKNCLQLIFYLSLFLLTLNTFLASNVFWDCIWKCRRKKTATWTLNTNSHKAKSQVHQKRLWWPL